MSIRVMELVSVWERREPVLGWVRGARELSVKDEGRNWVSL